VPVLVFDPNPAAVDARVSFRPPHLRHLKQKRKEISKHLNQKKLDKTVLRLGNQIRLLEISKLYQQNFFRKLDKAQIWLMVIMLNTYLSIQLTL